MSSANPGCSPNLFQHVHQLPVSGVPLEVRVAASDVLQGLAGEPGYTGQEIGNGTVACRGIQGPFHGQIFTTWSEMNLEDPTVTAGSSTAPGHTGIACLIEKSCSGFAANVQRNPDGGVIGIEMLETQDHMHIGDPPAVIPHECEVIAVEHLAFWLH